MNDETKTTETTATTTKSSTAKAKSKKPASKGKSTKPAAKSKSKGKKTTSKKPTKSKGKASTKGNGADRKPPADFGRAEDYARKISKEYGSVTVIRAVAQKYPSLERRDVMEIADKLGINKFTASRQFHVARSGEVEIDLAAL
jgi:hypothetical protein